MHFLRLDSPVVVWSLPLATHYETLGVSPNAEPEVIQGAYRALMRKYHPDANGGAYSDARAKQISEANATLSNPGLRAAYDAQLRSAARSWAS